MAGTDLVVSSSSVIHLAARPDPSSGSSARNCILCPTGTFVTTNAGLLLFVIQSVFDCPKFVSAVILVNDASSGAILSNAVSYTHLTLPTICSV